MINSIQGLKVVGNTIMTVAKHPTSVPKFGQSQRKLVSMYDEMLGGSKVVEDFKAGRLSEDEQWDILEKVMNLITSNKWIGANVGKTVGKHKVPRYLYHVTTKANYESMLKTGTLKVANDSGCGAGVYMLELQNMIKNYGNQDGYRGLERLINQARIKCDEELVLLRIPTNKLNASQITIRDNGASMGAIPTKFSCFDIIGDSAVNSKLYKQRKVGLEYIYPNDIDIKNVSMVGSAQVKPLTEGNLSDKESLEVWKILTKDSPEHKAFEVLG